jgi:hypothetical protein
MRGVCLLSKLFPKWVMEVAALINTVVSDSLASIGV